MSQPFLITLSDTKANPIWGEKVLLSFDQQQATIHLDYTADILSQVQSAARKLDSMSLPKVKLVGEQWNSDLTWVFCQGFYNAKTGANVELPELDDESITALNNKKSTINSVKSKTIGKSLIQKISWLFERESFTWDFCLFNLGMHKIFLRHIKCNLEKSRNNFVIIGHPKSLSNIKSFEKFITISKDKNYRFKTLIDMYDTINTNKHLNN